MADMIAERVRRYILDGGDEDLRRLLGVAETAGEMARSAFRRVGMQEGWHVIDCGCGPIGGLAVMAELAGPAGRVVGVDFSEPAIARARSVVAALQLGNVEVFAGDIHELDAAAVGGPFDRAAYRRPGKRPSRRQGRRLRMGVHAVHPRPDIAQAASRLKGLPPPVPSPGPGHVLSASRPAS